MRFAETLVLNSMFAVFSCHHLVIRKDMYQYMLFAENQIIVICV